MRTMGGMRRVQLVREGGTRRVQLVREGGTRRVQLVREGGGGPHRVHGREGVGHEDDADEAHEADEHCAQRAGQPGQLRRLAPRPRRGEPPHGRRRQHIRRVRLVRKEGRDVSS